MSDLVLLTRACAALTPASLQLPSRQARRLTFLARLHRAAGRLLLSLSPLAGEPCAGQWGVLDFRLDGRDLTVAGPVVDAGGGHATLRVERGPTARPQRASRVHPEEGSLVAVFVAEGTGLGRCYLPVLDVGTRGLRVTASLPLERGTELRDLVLLRRGQVLRHAQGTVARCEPVLEPDGRTAYHLGVRLRERAVLPPADDPADVCEITDAARVRATVWGLADLAAPAALRFGTTEIRCQLAPVRGNRGALPELRCVLPAELDVIGAVQLECTVFGSGFRLYARVQRREGRSLFLAPAPVVREWHRREEERLVLPAAAGGTVSFRHPLDGGRRERTLADVSVQGFGFERAAGDDALWAGLPLEDVRLELSGQCVRPARATVRLVTERRCGVHMQQLGERETDRLRAELLQLTTSPVQLHDGEDLDAILALHRGVKLLEADMGRNLEHTLDETRRTWRLGHRHPDGLMRTAMVPWKDGIGATATLVRAYETSWVLQHLAVASAAVPANPGMLHGLLMRLAVPRPDCEYVFSFADEEAKSLHTMMSTFFAAWSTPEHRGSSPFTLLAGAARRPSGRSAGVRALTQADESMAEHAALRLMHPVCARALGVRAGQLRLRSTTAAWRRGGLVRGREAWGAFRAGRPAAVLLREWASPGLSLSSLLNAGIYLPIEPDRDGRAARALVQVLLERPVPADPPVRFLFVPSAWDATPLLEAGLHKVAGCTLYAFQGLGMQEYHRYMAARYGFLHGRLRARVTEAA